ncbi:MAG: hypothetical protein ACYDDA_08100 [Acidiferrobacteraceae bacterium]
MENRYSPFDADGAQELVGVDREAQGVPVDEIAKIREAEYERGERIISAPGYCQGDDPDAEIAVRDYDRVREADAGDPEHNLADPYGAQELAEAARSVAWSISPSAPREADALGEAAERADARDVALERADRIASEAELEAAERDTDDGNAYEREVAEHDARLEAQDDPALRGIGPEHPEYEHELDDPEHEGPELDGELGPEL